MVELGLQHSRYVTQISLKKGGEKLGLVFNKIVDDLKAVDIGDHAK